MKTTRLFYVLLVALLVSAFGCSNQQSQPYQAQNQVQQDPQVTVNEAQPNIGDNLNLQAVGELLKQSPDPQTLERKLNEKGNPINNLDLNGDGMVDQLTVAETEKGKYTIIDNQADGTSDVAYLVVDAQPNMPVTVNINGNPQYYGNNSNYQSSFSPTDFMLMAYLMRPHYSLYMSPYHYGYYGYGYSPYPIMPYRAYHSSAYISSARTKTTYKTTTVTTTKSQPTFKSTSKSVSSNVATHASVSNPNRSQKSFSARDNSQPVRSGGFNSKPTASPSTSPVKTGSTGKSWGSSPSHTSTPAAHSTSSPSHTTSSPSHSWGSSSGGGRRSDVNSKENITPLAFNISDLSNINVVSYNYKPSWIASENLPSNKQYGYIAQNVEKTFPDLVTTDSHGKMVDYFGMIAVNTEAIKTLIGIVQSQQKEINDLKQQLKK